MDVGSHGFAFQADGSSTRVALPLEARDAVGILLERAEGIAVRELVRSLHEKKGAVHFRALGSALDALARAGALDSKREGPSTTSPPRPTRGSARLPLSLMRPVAGRVERRAGPAPMVFAALVVLAVAVGAWALLHPARTPLSLLRVNGSYVLGVALGIVGFSLLRSVRHLFKAVLLFFAQGFVPGMALRATPLACWLETFDEDFYVTARPSTALAYAIASVAVLPACAAVGPLIPWSWGKQLEVLGLVLALWELRPYGAGELSRLGRAFVRDELDGAQVPYLKTRAFATLLSAKSAAGEERLILYASLSLAWSIAGLTLMAKLLARSSRSVAIVLAREEGVARAAVLVVVAAVVVAGVVLALDLASTIAQNAASPLRGLARRAVRSLRSRDGTTADPATIERALAGVPLLRDCSDEARRRLAARGTMRTYAAGAPVVVQGEVGRELFALIVGSVVVVRRDEFGRTKTVATLRAPCVFGELAVLQDTPRTADVVAATEVTVLALAGDAFKTMTRDPAFAKDFERCVDRIALEQYFAASPAFRSVPSEVLSTLTNRGEFVLLPDGATLFEEGDPGDAFFMVLRGEVEAFVGQRSVGVIGQGSFVGEMALLSAQPRSATVVAKGDVRLLRLGAEDFWGIVSDNLDLAMFLEGAAEDRRRSNWPESAERQG